MFSSKSQEYHIPLPGTECNDQCITLHALVLVRYLLVAFSAFLDVCGVADGAVMPFVVHNIPSNRTELCEPLIRMTRHKTQALQENGLMYGWDTMIAMAARLGAQLWGGSPTSVGI
jgi:hypothetical protein